TLHAEKHDAASQAEGQMMRHPKRERTLLVGAGFLAVLVALYVGQDVLEKQAAAQGRSGVQAPRFEVDPLWPKPLPNHWVIGSTIGVWVDARDHIWIIHRAVTLVANELVPEK